MIASPFFGYYIFLPGTGTGCTWVVTTFVKTVSKDLSVSMPSRAYTSFLRIGKDNLKAMLRMCFNALSGLYLISTPDPEFEAEMAGEICFNALSGLYLISTVPLQKPRFYAVSRACFCRYLSEYSDSSRFSCMLTFWTYLMRCTYPWHWI